MGGHGSAALLIATSMVRLVSRLATLSNKTVRRKEKRWCAANAPLICI